MRTIKPLIPLSLILLLAMSELVMGADPEHEPGDEGQALEAFLNFPESVALDRAGNIYVTERGGNRVRRIDATSGMITTIAGTGDTAHRGDGGPATEATLHQPTAIAIDRDGAVIVGDTFNWRIRRIDPRTGIITTIAGTGEPGFDGDGGPAERAKISAPFGFAFDPDGNLHFTDTEVHRIRRIDRRSGIITTVAGNGEWAYGGDGGPATEASLARPHRIVFDPAGNLIIGDSFNQRIRRVDRRTGVIGTIAGTGLRGSSGDGGQAKNATFCYFGDMLFDRRGDLIVSGVCDNRIRRIDMRSGVITPFAGDGAIDFAGEGKPFLEASFATPVGLALGSNGIYVADMRAHRIRRLDASSGRVITVAGGKQPRNPVIPWRFVYKREDFIREQSVPVAHTVAGMDRVSVVQDIRYAGDSLRRFDLYRPPGNERNPPVVVLVSGRNDTEVVPDEWGLFDSRARLLAASGFAVVMFNHRLGLNGTIPQAAEDLELLLGRLRGDAETLGIDMMRFALVTYAIGSTVLPSVLRTPPAGLRAIVAFAPFADLRKLPAWQAPGKTGANAEHYSMAMSFAEGVTPPPMFIVRAGKDAAPQVEGVDLFVAEALRRNLAIEVVNHPEATGVFDWKKDDPRAAPILRRSIEFLTSAAADGG